MEFKDIPLDNFRFIGNTIDGIEICIEGVWLKKTMIGFSESDARSYFVFKPLDLYDPKAQKFLKYPIALPLDTIEALFSIREKLKDDYTELVNEGNKLLDKGEINRAIIFFSKAISLNCSREEAYASLANAYDELGEYKKAMIVLEKAREINSHNPDNNFNLGAIFKHLGIKLNPDKTIICSEDKTENALSCFLTVSYWGGTDTSSSLKQGMIIYFPKEEGDKEPTYTTLKKTGSEYFRSA